MRDVLNIPRHLTVSARAAAVVVSALALLPPAAASADTTGGWQRLHTTPTPAARQGGTLCYDPINRRVILFGGFNNGSPDVPSRPLSDTWAFAGRRWQRLSPSHSPAARAGASCAWDGHELLLYGGSSRYGSADMYDDTWTWTGTDWKELHPATSPGARAPAAFGYDGSELVLFGGWNPATSSRGDGRFGDTWTWHDGTWRQENDRVSPGPRSGSGSATWAGHGLLVNGGSRNFYLNDTWLHTAHGWRLLQQAGGTAPYGVSAAPLGGDVLGYTADYRNPTWLWHDGRWAPVSGSEPPMTDGAAVATLSANAVIMFGGTPQQYSDKTYATTYIYHPAIRQPAPPPRRTAQPTPVPRATPSPRSTPTGAIGMPIRPSATPTPSTPISPVVAARPPTSRGNPARSVAIGLAITALLASGLGMARVRSHGRN